MNIMLDDIIFYNLYNNNIWTNFKNQKFCIFFQINSINKPTNPIVVAAFQRDALLPPHMQNAFYKNPKIAEHLAQNSWFGPGEQHAVDRETEKIPREKIFLILKNAGLLPSP